MSPWDQAGQQWCWEYFDSTHEFTLVVQLPFTVLCSPRTISNGIEVNARGGVASGRRHRHYARFLVGGRCVGSCEQGR